MTTLKTIFFITFLILTVNACSQQKNNRTYLGKAYAENQLKAVLSNKKQHNVIDNKTAIIKDSLTAISVAEPILFSIYGKDNITKQQPYETYFIDTYWIISGTLPNGSHGGTFLIVLDAKDSKILRVTHGK